MADTVKERMLQAREAIKAKEYDKARKLLQGISHPTAKEWLDKLDKVAPQSSRTKSSNITRQLGTIEYGIIGAIAVVLIIVVGFFAFRFLSGGLQRQLTETLYSSGLSIQYPAGWNTNTDEGMLVLASPEVDINGGFDTFPENGKGLMVQIDNNVKPNFDIRAEMQNSSEDFPAATPLTDVQYGDYSGVAFGVNIENVTAHVVALHTFDDTLTLFIQLSENGLEADPLLDEMIRTFSISPDASILSCRVGRWWDGEAGQAIVAFLDTTETAGNTARISLAPIVTELQEQFRTFERMDYPPCLQAARDYIVDGMEDIVEGFQYFLGESETLSSAALDDAETAFENAYTALRELNFFGADIRLSVPSLMW